ncbi:MAG: hypothetical protein VB070_11075 [Clostridiaceae bacterium]|nr:hypothetical protein [Clostridiaceae bacterium]
MAINRFKQNRQVCKTAIVYLAVSAFCIIFDKIYALFGHGVSSASMSLMYLYPLAGGMLPFLILGLLVPEACRIRAYRPAVNLYHSGLAALTVSSLLNGVMEIAGTSSSYLPVFNVCGWTLLAAGLFIFLIALIRRQSVK